MIRDILGYIVIGLGILVCLFFNNYSGTAIPYPFLFWLLGIGMAVGGMTLFIRKSSGENTKEKERINKLIQELKTNGEKINVDFSKCEIKTNDFTEERERYTSSRIQMWNAIGGDSDKNIERVEIYQSTIVFKHQHNGKNEEFISIVIPKERTTLMFKLYDKKETILYVDKNNRNRYYFDLEFLQNRS